MREFDAEYFSTLQVRELNLSLQIRGLNGIRLCHLIFLLRADNNNSILLQVEHVCEIDFLFNRLLLSRLCLYLLIESLKLAPLVYVPEDEAADSRVKCKEQLLLFECMSCIHENVSSNLEWDVAEYDVGNRRGQY